MSDEGPGVLDAAEIFRALAKRDVEYVLIGGIAVQTHGHVRMTNDADITPAPDPDNLVRLSDALRSLGARVLNPGHEGKEISAKILQIQCAIMSVMST